MNSSTAFDRHDSTCEAGRRVMKVSPYDKTGKCYEKLEDVPEQVWYIRHCSPNVTACPRSLTAKIQLQVDAVNLIISPKIGMDVLSTMKKKGIRQDPKVKFPKTYRSQIISASASSRKLPPALRWEELP